MQILIHYGWRRGSPLKSLTLVLLAARLWFGADPVRAAGRDADSLELQVKAAFVYNFAKFVDWPEDTARTASPLAFCALAGDPFNDSLEHSLRGKSINGRVPVTRRITRPQEAHHCQVLYLGGLEKKRLEEYLDALAGQSVLTVGDSDSFAARGGMIQLIKDANKFQFAVNVDAVNRSGLRISSRLLQLAEVVHDSGGVAKRP